MVSGVRIWALGRSYFFRSKSPPSGGFCAFYIWFSSFASIICCSAGQAAQRMALVILAALGAHPVLRQCLLSAAVQL